MDPLSRFLGQLNTIIDSDSPVQNKLDTIDKALVENEEFLKKHLTPTAVQELYELAGRVSTLSNESAEKLKAIANQYFPPLEIVRMITQHVDSSTTEVLLHTSRLLRQFVIETYTGPLTALKVKTAEQAIGFAKEFGQVVRFLDISKIPFMADQLKTFLSLCPKLETLTARSCGLDDASATVLANVEKLKVLDLRENFIMEKGEAALKEAKKEAKTSLPEITEEGIRALAESPTLMKLTSLNLGNNQITDEGVRLLADYIGGLGGHT